MLLTKLLLAGPDRAKWLGPLSDGVVPGVCCLQSIPCRIVHMFHAEHEWMVANSRISR